MEPGSAARKHRDPPKTVKYPGSCSRRCSARWREPPRSGSFASLILPRSQPHDPNRNQFVTDSLRTSAACCPGHVRCATKGTSDDTSHCGSINRWCSMVASTTRCTPGQPVQRLHSAGTARRAACDDGRHRRLQVFTTTTTCIAGRMWDSQPGAHSGQRVAARRPQHRSDDDSFGVSLDVLRPAQRLLLPDQLNWRCSRRHRRRRANVGNNFDWNTVWDTRAPARFDGGWTSEMVIRSSRCATNRDRRATRCGA